MARRSLFIISDLHLGGSVSENGQQSTQMCSPEGRQRLAEFIHWCAEQRATTNVTLVLNGDTVDFLADNESQSFIQPEKMVLEKLDSIFENFAGVWDALSEYVRGGGDLVLLLGNHDIELCLPTVRRRLKERLQGPFEFLYDGEVYRVGSVVVEHGNQYDLWNRVDHDVLRETRSFLSRGEEPEDLPRLPGSELVVRVMNRIKREHGFVDLLKPETEAAIPLLYVIDPGVRDEVRAVVGILGTGSLRQRKVGVAGADAQSSAEIARARKMLEEGDRLIGISPGQAGVLTKMRAFRELWSASRTRDDRQKQMERLKTALQHFHDDAPDAATVSKEKKTYLKPARKYAELGMTHIVFGHTHLAKRVSLLPEQNAQYFNSGTWADLMWIPPGVFTGDAESNVAFEKFAESVAKNDLDKLRSPLPTYVRIDLEDGRVTNSDVYVFSKDQPERRLKDGPLWELQDGT